MSFIPLFTVFLVSTPILSQGQQILPRMQQIQGQVPCLDTHQHRGLQLRLGHGQNKPVQQSLH